MGVGLLALLPLDITSGASKDSLLRIHSWGILTIAGFSCLDCTICVDYPGLYHGRIVHGVSLNDQEGLTTLKTHLTSAELATLSMLNVLETSTHPDLT